MEWEHFVLGPQVIRCGNISSQRAVVLAKLVDRSLLTPEICSLNQIIGEFYVENLFTVTVVKKENKEMRGRERPIF